MLAVLATSIFVGVASFRVGYNLADTQWEYKAQYLHEQLENYEMRERLAIR